MKQKMKLAAAVLESVFPTMLLGCGFLAMVMMMGTFENPVWRALGAIAALCLLALWWMLRRQERNMRQVQKVLGGFREETIHRRSTMRFIFDELLDDSDTMRAQVLRTRQTMQSSLNVASGYLELVAEEIQDRGLETAGGYLREAEKAISRCTDTLGTLGRRQKSTDHGFSGSESSNTNTDSVRNRL